MFSARSIFPLPQQPQSISVLAEGPQTSAEPVSKRRWEAPGIHTLQVSYPTQPAESLQELPMQA